MMEPNQDQSLDRATSRLVDAVRQVKISAAERSDVVVEMREAERSRLELLVQELETVINDVPETDDRFDFAISSGLQPRFWIDVTAHVAMGPDRRTYRFLRDTRLGRIVLGESPDREVIAKRVTAYVAERLHERDLVFAGEVYSARELVSGRSAQSPRPADSYYDDPDSLDDDDEHMARWSGRGSRKTKSNSDTAEDATVPQTRSTASSAIGGMMWVLLGLMIGAAGLAWFFRDTLV